MDLIIRNGTVVSHKGRQIADVAVKDGKIFAVGYLGDMKGDKEIDAKGKFVIPGGIDTHTHHENPFQGCCGGDDFYTGSIAAACGGTTTMMDFSITDPGSLPYEFAQGRIKKALDRGIVIDFSFHCCLKEMSDAILEQVKDVIDLGLASFKVYMVYAKEKMMMDDGMLLDLIKEATKYGGLVGVHAENCAIADYNVAKAIERGDVDWMAHATTKPNLVEYEAIQRAITLARSCDTAMYIYHMSTKEGAQMLMDAQAEGRPVYAETCAHYLRLTDEIFTGDDGYLNLLSPPLRKKEDQNKLWEALSKKAIYCTGSDHAPFTIAEKSMRLEKGPDGKFIHDFTKVCNGAPGIELKLPTLINGVSEGKITWEQLVFANSYGAAKIFGMMGKKGELTPGADADIVIVDPNKEKTITGPEVLHMHCDHTPYKGLHFQGWPEMTILRGKIIVKDDEWVGDKGDGEFVKRRIEPEVLKTSSWYKD
ncbi:MULTISPECIES: dihydropyrimidinase [Anaerotruncus]|jgi:dihydropyrimidinase|uniref:dihydropyrimidinase n=1 Tax=Anaerotruncus TaxID=244127 RepID=UPI000E4B58D7|nr:MULTISPECIES: dihydropyrimidinase [Anaerotruncus]RGX55839.1 dihydropyrimidinase [Anaerotruncus sp. AF02-27]